MQNLGSADSFETLVASLAFWVAAIGGGLAALFLVFSVRNLVRAALALIVVLGSVAAMYAVLAADFLAVVQLVVYVGAIAVLIIFAIMMTPGQIDIPGLVGRGQSIGAFLVAAAMLLISGFVITSTNWNVRGVALNVPTAPALGQLMLTRYVLPFEIASLLLTVALIGAIVIARED